MRGQFRVERAGSSYSIELMSAYQDMAAVIEHIVAHALEREPLAVLAASLDMTPDQLRKRFKAWVGVTPTQFGRYLSLTYAKELLSAGAPTLAAAHGSGLSGGGRLHDLFVAIEAMTPGEYKNGGTGLMLRYAMFPTPFGICLAAASGRGVTNVLFADSKDAALEELRHRWPRASLKAERTDAHEAIERYLSGVTPESRIPLHLAGTNFQLKVWEALLSIPEGAVTTYGAVAAHAGMPRTPRAIGTAIGANPIAYLIPCHRVLKASGAISGYRWGVTRKRAMLAYEAVKRAS